MALSLLKKRERVTSAGFSSAGTETESPRAAEIRSGILITASAVALLSLVFLAGNFQLFGDTYEVEILFDYISGLEKNAPVHFAGHEVGKVTDITIVGEQQGQIAVTASISKKARLRKDSHAYVDMLGFMGEKFLELTPGSHASPILESGQRIRGEDPVALNEMMQKGTSIADELEKATISLESLLAHADETLASGRSDIAGILKNLNDTSLNLREMTEDLKRHPWKLLRKEKEERPHGKKRRFLFF